MASAVVKLFDIPGEAQKGLNELKERGYAAEDISSASVDSLANAWGLGEETLKYYQFGVALGGVLVGVKADEAEASEVCRILRSVEASPEREKVASSPAFKQSSRISATNPVNAPI